QVNGLAPGIDTIKFDIGDGAQTISVQNAALPAINNPVKIDGTAPADHTAQSIVLEGLALRFGGVTNANGLTLSGGDSTVQYLTIEGFPRAGIELNSVGHDTIQGNDIGTDASGGNFGNGYYGVLID